MEKSTVVKEETSHSKRLRSTVVKEETSSNAYLNLNNRQQGTRCCDTGKK